MSETLYMRMYTQNTVCSQCQMNTCHTSFRERDTETERQREGGGEREREREQTDVTDPKTDDGQVTMDVERFLVRVGGPSLSLAMGGWVRAKRTSSGMKSLCSDVGNGLLRSTSMLERN